MSEQSFKILFQTSLENNVKELEYWSNKFKGKIPKSIKNRIEKLKYVSSMQYKAEQEKEKQLSEQDKLNAKRQLEDRMSKLEQEEVGDKRESDLSKNRYGFQKSYHGSEKHVNAIKDMIKETTKESKDAKLVC